MTIHTLQNPSRLDECLAVIGVDDYLIFIDNAVYLLSDDRAQHPTLRCQAGALHADLERAGFLETSDLIVESVSYDQWIKLTEVHATSVLWD
jgi:sulfur relay protein TusB/DsrH